MGSRIRKRRKTKEFIKNYFSTLGRPSAFTKDDKYKPWANLSCDTLAEGSIRVLNLYPGRFGTPLYAKLEHVLLEDAEDDYEAISYAWGEHVYPRSIYLLGLGLLRITESLHSALQHLRYDSAKRDLWTDAICINQSDNSERSKQVAMMGSIFGSARTVLVWLGAATESDILAFATVAAFGKCYSPGSDMDFISNRLSTFPKCGCCEEEFQISENLAASGVLAVAGLAARPWFSRLWVLQEIFVKADERLPYFRTNGSVRICCGFHQEDWDIFQGCLISLDVYNLLEPHLPPNLERAIVTQRIDWLTSLFIDIPQRFCADNAIDMQLSCAERLCSDPLDRVFALRRLLRMEHIPELWPDYSLFPCEVYRRFVVACLDHVESDSNWGPALATSCIFAIIGTESDPPSDDIWPSWVPNLNSLTERSRRKRWPYLLKVDDHSVEQFFPEPLRFDCCIAENESRELRIKGCCFAKVDEVLIDSTWPVSLQQLHHKLWSDTEVVQLAEWYQRCKTFSTKYCGDFCSTLYFHIFLVCNQKYMLDSVYHKDTYAYRQAIQNALNPSWGEDEVEDIMAFLHLLRRFDSRHLDANRRLCQVIGDGFEDIAWVPRSAQFGDRLCIFAGEPFPFLVRDRGDGRFRLLGDAFVATTSLMQALGGTGKAAKRDFDVERDPSMDWCRKDEYMKGLLERLEWITLR